MSVADRPGAVILVLIQTAAKRTFNPHSTTGTKMIFDFWAEMPEDDNVHPKDRHILAKFPGVFRLEVPPGHVNGRLRTAPVVACFLNPGFEAEDERYLSTPEGRQMLIRQRSGEEPFPLEFQRWAKWFLPRVYRIGLTREQLADNVAILNVCAYASKNTRNLPRGMLKALPSAQVARQFLNSVLLREAREGRRFIVFCRGWKEWQVDPRLMEGANIAFVGSPLGGHFGPEIGSRIRTWLDNCNR